MSDDRTEALHLLRKDLAGRLKAFHGGEPTPERQAQMLEMDPTHLLSVHLPYWAVLQVLAALGEDQAAEQRAAEIAGGQAGG